MFWKTFKTQKEATLAFRQILNAETFGSPFENSLLSDLIHERHYFCSKHGLRPQRFRKIRDYGQYWLEMVWTPWDYVVRAMRDRVEDKATKKETFDGGTYGAKVRSVRRSTLMLVGLRDAIRLPCSETPHRA